MSVRNGIVLLVALSTLLFLAACGGNGTSIATPVAPPSGAFSNSNLNGTYVFSIAGTDANGRPPMRWSAPSRPTAAAATAKAASPPVRFDINDSAVFRIRQPAVRIDHQREHLQRHVDGRGQAVIATNITSGTPGQTFPNLTFDFVLECQFSRTHH